jgi:signal transduction histidine kinase
MSSATHAPAQAVRSGKSSLRQAHVFYWVVSLGGLAWLIGGGIQHAEEIIAKPLDLLPWAILFSAVHLFPVSWSSWAHLAVDMPVTAAAALVLSPAQIGLVGLAASFDPREFRGHITFTKALFNRTQIALSCYAASFAAHAVNHSPDSSPFVVPLALLALAASTATNYVLVGIGLSLEHSYPFHEVIGRLRLGTLTDFFLSFTAGAVIGAMLAALYHQVHPLTILAFLAPALLARQVLTRSQMFMDTDRAYQSREKALTQISHQIYEERTDERKLIAADLHDEVLQPLFRVTLLAHVVKAELASGRLIDIDEDLPELMKAAESASTAIRELIGDLRRSALGRGGLASAIWRLARDLEKQTSAEIHAHIDEVNAEPAGELAIYQIAKEALTNALTHSRAKNIWVELRTDSTGIQLSVRDDGVGFDPLAPKHAHYGIQIMRERALAVRAHLYVDTQWQGGCHVRLWLPGKSASGNASTKAPRP